VLITPAAVKSVQGAQLTPGELFTFRDGTTPYLGLVAKEPNGADKMMIVIGPHSPAVPMVPALHGLPDSLSVVSFGKDFGVRLPCTPDAWLPTEPAVDSPCVVLFGDSLYVRAVHAPAGGSQAIVYCSFGGEILADAGGFARPDPHGCAYAVQWALLTTEAPARVILSFA
jgi:hypothetical protein